MVSGENFSFEGMLFFTGPQNGFLKAIDFFFFMLGNPTMCQSLQNLLDVVHEYTSKYMFVEEWLCHL